VAAKHGELKKTARADFDGLGDSSAQFVGGAPFIQLAKREDVQTNQLTVITQQAVAMGLSAEAAAAAVARTCEAVALGAAAPPEDSPAATAMALAFANNLGATVIGRSNRL